MENFGERLKRERIARKLTQSFLANMVGVTRETIYKLENGINNPSGDVLVKLADALGMSTDSLAGKDVTGPRKIPVIEEASEIDVENPPATWIQEIIPDEWPENESYFALRIHGTNMEPRFYDHDVVICKRQNTAEYKDISAVSFKGSVFLCRYSVSSGNAILSFLNPKVTPLAAAEEDIKILGIVKELRARY